MRAQTPVIWGEQGVLGFWLWQLGGASPLKSRPGGDAVMCWLLDGVQSFRCLRDPRIEIWRHLHRA